jgi:transcription elongation factor GreA
MQRVLFIFSFLVHPRLTAGQTLRIYSVMSNISYFTPEGLQNLKDEVHQLEAVERPRISAQIAEARDKGDLSENAEYDAAKEAQGMLEAKISKLRNVLASARLVDDSQMDNSKVYILSTVRIKNLKNNMEVAYTLVAENEASLADKKISVDSPIGKGLLGKAIGDTVEVTVPAGIIPFEIIEITRG